MPTTGVFPMEGIEGTVNTPFNLHTFKWKLWVEKDEKDNTGFGDGDEELTSVVKRRYFWSIAAFANEDNTAPTGTVLDGTVAINLYNGTHSITGAAIDLQYQEEHDHASNVSFILMAGRYVGQPTFNG